MADLPGGPVFVVGPMGSGTTLMRLVLDSHENLAIAPETGLARLLLANEYVPFWKFGGEWYGRLGVSRDELDAAMREFYGGLYGGFAARRGATRWGDKTPFHTWHMHRLARVFPDAVFVGTVRHPGAVASSVHERFGFTWEAGVRHWVRSTTEMLYRGSRLGDRFLLCRYEDLVVDPEATLREVFCWLGEPWSPRVLAFHEVHRDRGTTAQVEGRTRSDEPLDAERVAKWTRTVDPGSRRLLARDTGALAVMLGYAVGDPVPVGPLGGSADENGALVRPPGPRSITVTGNDVERLMSQHPGIDWEKRPRPTLENRPLRIDHLRRLRQQAAQGAHRPSPAATYGWVLDESTCWSRRMLHRLPEPVQERVREVRRALRRRRAG